MILQGESELLFFNLVLFLYHYFFSDSCESQTPSDDCAVLPMILKRSGYICVKQKHDLLNLIQSGKLPVFLCV